VNSIGDLSLPRVHVYGHVSAQPKAIAEIFAGQHSNEAIAESELAIFAINPAAGIDQETIDLWNALSDYQLPRLVVVNELDGSDSDFDDAVLLANRVFDQLVTPYLVLHNDAGDPTALIDLQSLEIVDYTTQPASRRDSDPEHKELVADFRNEYLEAIEDAGEKAFEAGLLFPAIPVVITKGIGVDIVKSFIERVASY
jgi:translation elongation factor EF-G